MSSFQRLLNSLKADKRVLFIEVSSIQRCPDINYRERFHSMCSIYIQISIHNINVCLNSSGTFRINREGLIIGTNTIDLVFIMCCNSQPQTVHHTLSLTLQRGLVSTFRVDLITYIDPVGGEVCNVGSTACVEDNNVLVTVVLCNDNHFVFGYSINGADSQPGSDFQGKKITIR